jgi:histidinol-phosphate aminotransferase
MVVVNYFRPAIALMQGYTPKDNYNVDAIAILVGAAAMRDQEYKNTCVEKVKRSRSKLATDLQQN